MHGHDSKRDNDFRPLPRRLPIPLQSVLEKIDWFFTNVSVIWEKAETQFRSFTY
jgi:hypothetical protein